MYSIPKMTQYKLITKFIIVSDVLFLYPPFWALKDMSNSPRNNIALPEAMEKKTPYLSPVNRPIAASNRAGAAQNMSGIGKDLSKARKTSVFSGFLFSTKKKYIQNPPMPIAPII